MVGAFRNGWIPGIVVTICVTVVVILSLQPLLASNPPLYQALISIFSAIIASSLFIVVWNGRRHTRDAFLLILGVGFLAAAAFEILYMLAAPGLALFEPQDTDLSLQLWIAGHYVQSITLFVAAIAEGRKAHPWATMLAIAIPSAAVLGLIFAGAFPPCIDGQQLTSFKMISEYIIGGLFLGASVMLWWRRSRFDNRLFWLLATAFALMAGIHIFFMDHKQASGIRNHMGDVAHILAYVLLYKAVVETAFSQPLRSLFREVERGRVLLAQAAEVSGFGAWSWDEGNGGLEISESLQNQLRLPSPSMTFEEFATRVHKDDLDRVRREVELALSGAETFSMEIRLQDPVEWELRFVYVRGKVERLANGRRHAFGSVLNITSRKEAEALREDVERMTRHDIKSPLSSLLLVPELLLEKGGFDEEQSHMLETLRYEARRMNEMLNRFLDLHRMELGAYRLRPEPVNLIEIITMIRDACHHSSRGRIELFLNSTLINGEDAEFYVMGERLLLHNMFSHLMDNAVEASPTGVPVCIRIREESAHWARIEIENEGEVPEPIRDCFFQKYVSYGKRNGTGLGAYTAKLIATTHGGNIHMRTGAYGTVITVRLPK